MYGKGVNRFMPVQLNNDSSEKKLKASQARGYLQNKENVPENLCSQQV